MRYAKCTAAVLAAATFLVVPPSVAAPSSEPTKVLSTPAQVQAADLAAAKAGDPSLTDAQAARSLDISVAVSDAMVKFTSDYKSYFGYMQYLPKQDVLEIHGVGEPTAEMRAFVATLKPAVKTRFVADQQWTKAQIETATSAAGQVISSTTSVGEGGGGYNMRTGQIEFSVAPEAGFTAADSERAAEQALEASPSAQRALSLSATLDGSSAPAEIPVVVTASTKTKVDFTLISGGTALNSIPPRSDGKPVCTGAFTARVNGTSRTGLITARHCGTVHNHLGYEGRDILVRSHTAGFDQGDAQLWESSKDSVSANFIYDRSGSTLFTRPLKRIGIPGMDAQVYNYGSTTAYQRNARVVGYDRYIFDPRGNRYDNLIAVGGFHSELGDSGGPWFLLNTGYGVQSGRIQYADGRWETVFAPITDVVRSMGVTPIYG